jgi:hypothetical protein
MLIQFLWQNPVLRVLLLLGHSVPFIGMQCLSSVLVEERHCLKWVQSPSFFFFFTWSPSLRRRPIEMDTVSRQLFYFPLALGYFGFLRDVNGLGSGWVE